VSDEDGIVDLDAARASKERRDWTREQIAPHRTLDATLRLVEQGGQVRATLTLDGVDGVRPVDVRLALVALAEEVERDPAADSWLVEGPEADRIDYSAWGGPGGE